MTQLKIKSGKIPSKKRKSRVLKAPVSEYNLLPLFLLLLKSTYVTFEKEDTHQESVTKNNQVGFQVYGRYYVYGITNNKAQGNLVQLYASGKIFSRNMSLERLEFKESCNGIIF